MTTADIRPVLLDLLESIHRAVQIYRAAVLRSDTTTPIDLRGLADFCEWAELAVIQGRALLVGDGAGASELRYCPPSRFDIDLASRIEARRALRPMRPRPRPPGSSYR